MARFASLAGFLMLPLALQAGPPPWSCPPGGTALRWEDFGLPFLEKNCNGCHTWNNYTTVYQMRIPILSLVTSNNMPPLRPIPEDEQSRLIEWIACDMPLTGPSCAPGGTPFGYRGSGGAPGFGETLFEEHCTSCHSKELSGLDRNGAPTNMNWDNYPDVVHFAADIRDQVLKGNMPPGAFVPQPEVDALIDWVACGVPELPQGAPYRRSDSNDDGKEDISDAVSILFFLFTGEKTIGCLDAADSDSSGKIDITDALYLLRYLFLSSPPPPPPFETCGGPLTLGCEEFTHCQ